VNTASHYDVAIIGAGMSGLAAGIRLAHFGRKVCIFERHNAVGGLNSFYSIAGRRFDVGLHAVTNFVDTGVKGTPLGKLLRQLRIEREAFALCPQLGSRIAFGPGGETSLGFTNDPVFLESEVARVFPNEVDRYRALVAAVRAHDDVSLDAPQVPAREIVRRYIRDPLLEDMLFCPIMYYGSAQERDMEFGQFATMFKALFLEGFARPAEGVRVIVRALLDRYRSVGGERRMKCGVRRIVGREGRVAVLELDSGEEITADHVISSIGARETELLLDPSLPADRGSPVGRLSFIETISVLNGDPAALGCGSDTIVFFNDSARFDYARPQVQVDVRSGVICIPNNFRYPDGVALPEGLLRVTCLANHDSWVGRNEDDYQADKRRWFPEVLKSAARFLPPGAEAAATAATVATDMFTPRTITKYTGHLGGAVYGSPTKNRQGRTALSNLYLCGTDQGFLGIIGAMLSGISMANFHILQKQG
jgi:phytoene dehydrogenase-like protein